MQPMSRSIAYRVPFVEGRNMVSAETAGHERTSDVFGMPNAYFSLISPMFELSIELLGWCRVF